MKYVTHDDMTPRETIHDDEIEVVYGMWEIPETAVCQSVHMLRIGPHGFIHNLGARCCAGKAGGVLEACHVYGTHAGVRMYRHHHPPPEQ